MKKVSLLVLISLSVILFWFYLKQRQEILSIALPAPISYDQFINSSSTESGEEIATTTEEEIVESKSINLAVPFTSQAPTGNWEQPWQDACEEASFLMVDYYYQNKSLPESSVVEKTLAEMVDWQITNWGEHKNLPVAEVKKYIETVSDYQVEIIELTSAKLKELLATGQPVIIPADGHKLDNPNFTGDGPDYHMLVVKGYVGDKFITNDPGTRNGADYVYTADKLFSALADWLPDKAAASGPQYGLIIKP